MKAVRVHKTGGLEVLKLEDIPEPRPGSGQVLIRHEAIGVNFIDIYFRSGLYKTPLPFTVGLEGAGTIAEIGLHVVGLKPGDRVAYIGPLGAYAQSSVVPQDRVVKLPSEISFKTGAAAMVQGITAHYLAKSTYPIKKGDVCLVHAAAGGVGLLLTQVAKLCGATVIGTVSTEEKAALARQAGADYVILYSQKDFVAEVRTFTGGQGVQVVYDGVGQATFDKSLDCLARRGMMVLYGQASGAVAPIDLSVLNQKGSLYVTRPGINAYIADRQEYAQRAEDVFTWVRKKKITINVHHEFPLEQAKEAQKALEERRTTGKVILVP